MKIPIFWTWYEQITYSAPPEDTPWDSSPAIRYYLGGLVVAKFVLMLSVFVHICDIHKHFILVVIEFHSNLICIDNIMTGSEVTILTCIETDLRIKELKNGSPLQNIKVTHSKFWVLEVSLSIKGVLCKSDLRGEMLL
jgi:hypothetical protein